MAGRRALGRQFGWLWTASGVSALGTWLAFGAFPLIAIRVLHTGPAGVSALAAVGTAAGAVVAVPLGPWVELRRKRPVLVAMDLTRFAALASIPAAFAFGALTFAQLLAVSAVTGAAGITFRAAGGAFLKSLLPPEDLLTANARLESVSWAVTVLAPPLGGVAIAVSGPVTTVVADAVSYLLSALGIRAIGGREPHPARTAGPRPGDLTAGWRHILAHPVLRPLFVNTVLVNALIMATEPVLTVLMLGRLHFPPWQYGLAFASPCAGGLAGARLAPRLAARFGEQPVLRVTGALRVIWPLWLVFVRPGPAGLALVIAVQLGLVTCIGMFNPVLASYRLGQIPADVAARMLSAWTVSGRLAIAVLTALWGVLAGLTTPRIALAAAGVLLLATPLLLPRRLPAPQPEPVRA